MGDFSIPGISIDLLVLILLVLVVVLLIGLIVTNSKLKKLQKTYKVFMEGSSGRSLEKVLKSKLAQIDGLAKNDEIIRKKLDEAMSHLDGTFQKIGLVKYNAFNDLGGKLSFSLAMLNRKNDGFILNAMHSREGCFTYMKEVINGNAVTMLADEEKEALEQALKTEEN